MPVNPYEPPKFTSDPSQSDYNSVDNRTLRYFVDFDDFMGLQKYHYANSPSLRNQRYVLMGFTAFSAVVLSVLVLHKLSFPYRSAIATLNAMLSALVVRGFLNWSMAYQVKKLFREGDNDGIVGEHELRIDEKNLTEITSVSETRQAVSSIKRIEETDDYAIIYVSALQASIIPKKKIASGDIIGFMVHLQRLAPNAIRRT